MKRLLAILLIALPFSSAFADNTVRSVTVNAKLDSLGNARICETWDVNIDSRNTEWYLSLSNLGEGRIHSLTVRDLLDGKTYRTESRWDVDRSREQKAGRCGIVEKSTGNYELCWGVTSDGDHLWEVSYDYDNLVTAFSDSCAFNHMFITDELSSLPGKARVEISFPGKAITDSIASIWAFGYKGAIRFSDGSIVAESDGALSDGDGIIVMAAFDKTMFNTVNTSEDSFSVMKDRAFEGSDYVDSKMTGWDYVILILGIIVVIVAGVIIYGAMEIIASVGLVFVLFGVIPFVWSIVTLFPLRRYIKKLRLLGFRPYTRKIPEGNDLTHIPYILDKFSYDIFSSPANWDDNMTAAYILRLISEDALYIDNKLLHVRKGWDIEPGKYSEADTEAMKNLYKIIKDASGVDLILQEGELKAYKKAEGLALIKEYYKMRKIEDFSLDREEAVQIMGLKAYIKDFTLMKERDVPEVALWNEYLVYATVFGLGNKAVKTMKKLAPDYPLLKMVCDESGEYMLSGPVLRDVTNGIRNLKSESEAKSKSSGNGYGGYSSRSSGGGGHSSHRGGGGHSGGGRGGGR